jgi:hypothetical protein
MMIAVVQYVAPASCVAMKSRLPFTIMRNHPGYNFVGGGYGRRQTTLRHKQWKRQNQWTVHRR